MNARLLHQEGQIACVIAIENRFVAADMITVLTIAFFGSVLLAAFLVFDRLVRLEYRSYRRNWDADGQPHGFFWVPPEVKRFGGWAVSLRSDFASKRCSHVWLFSTPDWIRKGEEAPILATYIGGFLEYKYIAERPFRFLTSAGIRLSDIMPTPRIPLSYKSRFS